MAAHNDEITVERLWELYISIKKENEYLREDIDALSRKVEALQSQVNSE